MQSNTFKIRKDMDSMYEILNEVDKEIVWNDILNFIRDISSK